MSTLFVCSLGGSPAPVQTAIGMLRTPPVFVLFVTTAQEGGQPGSDSQVPAIVATARLADGQYGILAVPADEPDAAFQAIAAELAALRGRFPGARMLFDYTGGTKSMTAALLQAALLQPGAAIQVMTGQRRDLQKVRAGTERPHRINPAWMLAQQRIARHRAAWASYAYAESASGFAAELEDLESDEQAEAAVTRLRDLRDLSTAFAEWDRFRHDAARRLLQPLEPRHSAFLAPYLKTLAVLCGPPQAGRTEAARLADLWHNAGRAAARGRYDDAVARCYRLVEWVAQWRLRAGFSIDTGAMDWAHEALTRTVISRAELGEQQGRRTLSGLLQAMNLCLALEPQGAFARFLTHACKRALRDLLELRNRSILAHGSTPLDEADWQRFHAFLERFVADVLKPELERAGLPALPPQLPQSPPPDL